jgi:replicative DNA helicase
MIAPITSALAAPLPQSPEAEAALLACCLLDAEAPDSTIARAQSAGITSADFLEPANGILYREIVRLQNESPPCTDGMLVHHLRTIEKLDAVGGMARIVALTGTAPTTAHAKRYISQVKDCAQLRHGITAAQRYIEQATRPDAKAADLVAELHADLDRIADTHPGFGSGISAAALCAKPPQVPPELISGVLYGAGTMLLSGPSKLSPERRWRPKAP